MNIGIIIGVFQSLFTSMGLIATKKVLEKKKVGNNIQTFFSRFNHFLILGVLILFGIFGFTFDIPSSELTLYNIFLFILSVGLLYTTYPLRRTAYANEKVSVLQPFSMLFQVFPIIIGFLFIASERTSLITFLIAILASIVVILTSIDYKKLKFNKYSLMVLLSSTIKSFQIFIVYYFLTILTPETLYFIETILITIISLFLIFIKKESYQFKLINKNYFRLLMFANTIGLISVILVLNMYTSIGIVATSLMSLLSLGFTYLLGYFFLKEIPSKKDVIVTVFVIICIGVGMYFKTKAI